MAKRPQIQSDVPKTTLRIPPELWKQARMRALMEDRTAQAVVIDALKAYLAKPFKATKGVGRAR